MRRKTGDMYWTGWEHRIMTRKRGSGINCSRPKRNSKGGEWNAQIKGAHVREKAYTVLLVD